MNVNTRWSVGRFVLLWMTLLLVACSTLSYRDIQRDFNAAVEADNIRSVEALGALTSSGAEQLYEGIRLRLTDGEISRLDDRLKPNAYAIRAVAEWRTGKLAEARGTAIAGLKLSNVAGSPRDQMVLEMIPALVIDEELVSRFRRAGMTVSKLEYDARYASDFATAASTLKDVGDAVLPSTPEAILYYVSLQRWRILQNWRVVISKIQEGPEAREAAREDAGRRLGVPLLEEIKRIEESVPAGEPIRKAMEALALR